MEYTNRVEKTCDKRIQLLKVSNSLFCHNVFLEQCSENLRSPPPLNQTLKEIITIFKPAATLSKLFYIYLGFGNRVLTLSQTSPGFYVSAEQVF